MHFIEHSILNYTLVGFSTAVITTLRYSVLMPVVKLNYSQVAQGRYKYLLCPIRPPWKIKLPLLKLLMSNIVFVAPFFTGLVSLNFIQSSSYSCLSLRQNSFLLDNAVPGKFKDLYQNRLDHGPLSMGNMLANYSWPEFNASYHNSTLKLV